MVEPTRLSFPTELIGADPGDLIADTRHVRTTPKNAVGAAIAEKELAGGLSFTTPAFKVTAANIRPDRETGIGDWSDDDIKHALIEGARPADARLPGTPLAAVMPANFHKALLPRDLDAIVACLRSVKPVRNQVAPPNYLQPVHRDAYPDAEAGSLKSRYSAIR